MEWIKTDSTNIAQFRYDKETSTLEVEFLKGGVYQYFGVEEHVFEEMQNASSKGQFLAQNIKGIYRYARA